MPATSQPSPQVLTNIIENENLAWERFQRAVIDEDINVSYDMSLKDFEHSGVHDLFKVIVFVSSLKIHIYIYIYYFYLFYYFIILLLLLFYFDHLFLTFL